MHVFVTGATGLVGRALCGALAGKGHVVTALTRSLAAAHELPSDVRVDVRVPSDVRVAARELPSDVRVHELPSDVRVLAGDPTLPGPWQDALARADACVHLAGEPIAEGRWTAERKRRIASSRIDSTARVAEVIASRGPTVLVQASAVGFYGERGDEVLDESAGPGEGFLADVSRAWEDAAAPARERARVVALRTGVVLAREGGALPRLARPFRLFAGGPIGDGRFWMPWIHVADEVGLALLALEDARAEGPLNASAPEPVRNRDLARALGAALSRPSLLAAPAFAVRLAIGEMADALLASQRVVPRKALDLGYRFRFPEIGGALADLLR